MLNECEFEAIISGRVDSFAYAIKKDLQFVLRCGKIMRVKRIEKSFSTEHPVVGVVQGNASACTWTLGGRFLSDSRDHLYDVDWEKTMEYRSRIAFLNATPA